MHLLTRKGNRLLNFFFFFFQEHFQEVTQHQEFLQLPTEEAARLLASDDLNVPSEELIFQVNEMIYDASLSPFSFFLYQHFLL